VAPIPTAPTAGPIAGTAQTAGIAQTRSALGVLRPSLLERYDAAVPAARAAVLARLLGALDREPLPGIASRARDGDIRRVTLADGRIVSFPAAAGRPFADAGPGLAARIDEPGPGVTGEAGPGLAARIGEPGPGVTDEAGPGLTARIGEPGPAAGGRAARTDVAVERRAGACYDDPGELVRALWPGAGLAAEIDNSVANLALARANDPDRTGLRDVAGDPGGLGRLEQRVIDGHPLHPCCRTRGGMSVADVLAYAPEHRPVIRLRRLRVPDDRWHGDAPPLLYAHPWQAQRLRDAYPWLVDAGETGPVRPLMSLRTVAPIDGGDHVKTAVDVQMTSAVRTVSPAAVHNGPRLSALLRKLTADLPLSVLAETAAGAVIVDGQPSRHLAHVRREAPGVGAGEAVLPLAALGVPGLLREAVGDRPYGWFGALAAILWGPLLTVLDRGVALEAHGQNTLVVLRAGRPVRIVYRDLGGVRVSSRRLRAAGVEPPDLHGDLPTDNPVELRTKLAAASVATVAAELITLLSRQYGADPERLWGLVAASIRAAGTADGEALLREPLPIKATTAMRLGRDPLADRWTSIDNPAAAHA
jgi:staphyloferrin A synthase